jgi:elongation factor Ts
MTQVDAKQVMALRDQTGAPAMECKRALVEAEGNLERAVKILRARGAATAEKKAARTAAEGRVFSYIHHNNKVGVLVEVNCETDFVARNSDFEQFLKDLCLHIAFKATTRYLTREQVPAAEVEQARKEIADQMTEHRGGADAGTLLEKWYAETCLMEQAFVKDEKVTIEDLRKLIVAKCGENVVIRRFARFEVGR